jgi:hypothetical protein
MAGSQALNNLPGLIERENLGSEGAGHVGNFGLVPNLDGPPPEQNAAVHLIEGARYQAVTLVDAELVQVVLQLVD